MVTVEMGVAAAPGGVVPCYRCLKLLIQERKATMRLRWVVVMALLAGSWAQTESKSQKEGRQWARKLARAIGLNDKQPVQSLRATFTQGEGAAADTITATIVPPDHLRAEVRSSHGLLVLVFTPEEAFMVVPDGSVREVSDAQKEESLEEIVRDPIYLAGHWNDPKISFTDVGGDRIGNTAVQIVDVQEGEVAVRWFLEQKTGRLLRQEYQSLNEHGRLPAATELSDWRPMGGLNLPAEHKNYEDGELKSVVVQTGLEVNPTVDPRIFARPAGKPN